MSRIRACFERLSREGRRALVPFITAGDPSAERSLEVMHALVPAGADVIELGIPFSDPMADGPVIQRASERALAGGMCLAGVLDTVRRFREHNDSIAVVLMGYLNPVETCGYARFAAAAAAAGVDGVLMVDMPPEEGAELHEALGRHGLDRICIVSPTTSDERIRRICEQASGYLYYVSLKGVTGASHLDVATVSAHLERVRAATRLPVGVGFGIRDATSAAAVAAVADAVVVGSVLVRQVEELLHRPEAIAGGVARRLAEMRAAMDGGA